MAATSPRNKSGSTMEIDIYADTTVSGIYCLPAHDFRRQVDVSGYDSVARNIECPTISGALAYDHPITVKIYMLVYHQAIQCKSLTKY